METEQRGYITQRTGTAEEAEGTGGRVNERSRRRKSMSRRDRSR